jgi:molecular chaperone GrpE (heat shock protein)
MNRVRLALDALLHGDRGPAAPAAPQIGGGAVPDVSDRLIDLRDNVLAARVTIDGAGGAVLDVVARQLADILGEAGVELFDDSGPFEPKRHRVAGTVATDDATRHHHIAESVRSGCARDGRVVRPQLVIVYETSADG